MQSQLSSSMSASAKVDPNKRKSHLSYDIVAQRPVLELEHYDERIANCLKDHQWRTSGATPEILHTQDYMPYFLVSIISSVSRNMFLGDIQEPKSYFNNHVHRYSPTRVDTRRARKAYSSAKGKAYSPYSNFRVGAALFATDGNIILGSNIENASYERRHQKFLSYCGDEVCLTPSHRRVRDVIFPRYVVTSMKSCLRVAFAVNLFANSARSRHLFIWSSRAILQPLPTPQSRPFF
ncbi:cytidine and deoxycytidylate deaminase zinc-binding region domain-containing protein [Rhizoctonia solani AG-1 IA]|uniref:Cytidine and deoxycytidylate deaminase zinc-binding region domain-containing protein n=1 Tax=Thanatephorus cucumeris (strain AG1-IA) TaxID=983506 RepID=L8WPD4_THACA|nr:cytidine and deoxycytidylate deaminase zinc-binding region domain-containing protein [Rhizoctonia solani AG-1 IA]